MSAGGLFGGLRHIVAMHHETGLVIGMHADEDGDANDVRLNTPRTKCSRARESRVDAERCIAIGAGLARRGVAEELPSAGRPVAWRGEDSKTNRASDGRNRASYVLLAVALPKIPDVLRRGLTEAPHASHRRRRAWPARRPGRAHGDR